MNSSVRLPNHDTRAKLEKVLAITSKDIHYIFAADRREAAHYSCDDNIVTRALISMPSYV